MHPKPTIIVLSQGVADQKFDKSEEINCLAENDKVVSFVKNGVPNIHTMDYQNHPT